MYHFKEKEMEKNRWERIKGLITGTILWLLVLYWFIVVSTHVIVKYMNDNDILFVFGTATVITLVIAALRAHWTVALGESTIDKIEKRIRKIEGDISLVVGWKKFADHCQQHIELGQVESHIRGINKEE
jgi:uncharacterized membrane protein